MFRFARVVPVGLLLLVLAGCNPGERKTLAEHGQDIAHVKDQVTASITKISKDAQAEALRAARAKAIELQGQLSDVRMPTELQKVQLGALTAQIKSIDAALEERSLQDRLKDAQAQAQEAQANVQKGVKDAESALIKAQNTARELSDQIAQAQKAYQDASATFDSYAKQLKSLMGE